MKKRISFLLAVIMVLAVMIPAIPVSAEPVTSTTNTWNSADTNPKISTVADYNAFLEYVYGSDGVDMSGRTVTLEADLVFNDDYKDADWYSDGDVTAAYTSESWKWFKGVFDGQGHTVYGLYLEGGFRSDMALGFIPCLIGDTSAVKNLTIDTFYVKGTGTSTSSDNSLHVGVGAVVGVTKSGTIENCIVKNGTVTADASAQKAKVGSVVGIINTGSNGVVYKVKNCYSDNVTLSGPYYNGAAVGYLYVEKESMTLDFEGSVFSTNGETPAIGAVTYSGPMPFAVTAGTGKSNTALGTSTGGASTVPGKTSAICTQLADWGIVKQLNEKFVGIQTMNETATDADIRFVGLVKDYENLSNLGFEVTANGITKPLNVTKVYSSILAGDKTLPAPEGYKYYTFVLKNVPNATEIKISTTSTDNASETDVGYQFTCTYTYTAPSAS